MSSEILALPKVLLMGLRKSGKSSIQKVVFEGMQPHDSANLPATVQPDKTAVHSNDFVNFEVWDFPGQNDPFNADGAYRYDKNRLLENCGAIVFVLDCRELLDDAYARLMDTICAAYLYSPLLNIEVFIHKVDWLTEDQQSDILASLQRRVQDEARQRLELTSTSNLHLNFNLTSIYDHSVFQAFSLVVQKLIKNKHSAIMEALQMCNSNCDVELSYLLFSRSKIFLASHEHNRDRTRTYELCSDAVEVVVRIMKTYAQTNPPHNGSTLDDHSFPAASTDGLAVGPGVGASTNNMASTGNNGIASGTGTHNSTSGLHAAGASATAGGGSSGSFAGGGGNGGAAAGASSLKAYGSSIISLSNDDCLYIRDLPSSLTIVMMMKQHKLENRALIDYNIDTFYRAVYDIFSSR